MQIAIDYAERISHHHKIAREHADQAIHHAAEAGKLLLEVKNALPHGQFNDWIAKNLAVSERQAQRYMSIARGEPVPIRSIASKTDTVSLLPVEKSRWAPNPTYIPLPGYWYVTLKDGNFEYVVEPSKVHPGYFFISQSIEETGETLTLTRPIAAVAVSDILRRWGLTTPELADWQVHPSEGVTHALETFGVPPPPKPDWMTRVNPTLGS